MSTMKVSVDWGLCDANGVCAIEAPDVFELTDDDELEVLKEDVGPEDVDQVRSAIRVCPKHAITLSD
ncbi:ferredoxin [Rhodococcus koreensis]